MLKFFRWWVVRGDPYLRVNRWVKKIDFFGENLYVLIWGLISDPIISKKYLYFNILFETRKKNEVNTRHILEVIRKLPLKMSPEM